MLGTGWYVVYAGHNPAMASNAGCQEMGLQRSPSLGKFVTDSKCPEPGVPKLAHLCNTKCNNTAATKAGCVGHVRSVDAPGFPFKVGSGKKKPKDLDGFCVRIALTFKICCIGSGGASVCKNLDLVAQACIDDQQWTAVSRREGRRGRNTAERASITDRDYFLPCHRDGPQAAQSPLTIRSAANTRQ